MVKQYKVRLNSSDKLEELLQEIYDQSCKHIVEIENNVNVLKSSTNLGEDGITIDDKVKFAKAEHDFNVDRQKAINMKLDIAKFMGEVLKFNGDANAALNDNSFKKTTKLDVNMLRSALNSGSGDDNDGEIKSYQLK